MLVEKGAGLGKQFPDEDYVAAGAALMDEARMFLLMLACVKVKVQSCLLVFFPAEIGTVIAPNFWAPW